MSAAVRCHARSGGARDWCDRAELGAGTASAGVGANGRTADCGAPIALTGGGGSAAVSSTQPTQQESTQTWLPSWCCDGAASPAPSLWQITVAGAAAARAAALPAAQLATSPLSTSA